MKEVAEGEAQLITHRSGDEVVMISRERLNEILEENEVLKAIAKGRADVAAGRIYSQDEAKERLSRMQAKW